MFDLSANTTINGIALLLPAYALVKIVSGIMYYRKCKDESHKEEEPTIVTPLDCILSIIMCPEIPIASYCVKIITAALRKISSPIRRACRWWKRPSQTADNGITCSYCKGTGFEICGTSSSYSISTGSCSGPSVKYHAKRCHCCRQPQ